MTDLKSLYSGSSCCKGRDELVSAVNALKEKYKYPEWHFNEVANDIQRIN